MSHRNSTRLSVFAALLAAAPAAAAQLPTAVIRQGDTLAGQPGTVGGISGTAVGFPNAWAVTLNTSDGVTTVSHVFGSYSGGVGTVLRSEGVVAGQTQTAFEGFFGVNAGLGGSIAYSPTLDTGSGTLDTVWLDDTPIAVEGDPIPTLPGTIWRFASRPSVLLTNEPVWIGGIDQGATSLGNGLFRGAGAFPVLRSLDVVPGIPFPLTVGNAIDFDFRFSPGGLRYITPVDTGEATGVNTYMVQDGAALVLGGGVVNEGEPVPASVGGLVGENWDNFDFVGITDFGRYFFTGDTDGPTATDEFVVVDGTILMREGDVVDGYTLTGSIDGGYMNGQGDFAVTWDVVDGASSLECLIFNGRVVAIEGQAVDFDGDGQVDPNAILRDFTGINALALGADRVLLATADIDLNGTTSSLDDVQVALLVPIAPLTIDRTTLSLSAGGTARFGLFPPAGQGGQLHFLLGSASGSTPGVPIDSVLVPLVFDVYTSLTLNGANQPPLVGGLGFYDALGTGRAEFTLPPGALPSLAGITLTHAYVGVTLAPVPVVSYVSNTVELLLVP